MKHIKYKFVYAEVNRGTEENPDVEQAFVIKRVPYSEEALLHAKEEAHNGEYTIEDDGLPEPVAPENTEPTWDELAAALQEGVDAV